VETVFQGKPALTRLLCNFLSAVVKYPG
jgi:hypothetical protein